MVDKLAGCETGVPSIGEHRSSLVESTTKAAADGEEARREGRNKVFASATRDDSVHGAVKCVNISKVQTELASPRDCGTVISRQHEHHFDEFSCPLWEAALEPEQADDTSETDVFLKYVRNAHAGVDKLLTTLIRDS